MINPSYQAIGELYEIAARRRFDEDWGDVGQVRATAPRGRGLVSRLRSIGAWLAEQWSDVRFAGAYGVAR